MANDSEDPGAGEGGGYFLEYGCLQCKCDLTQENICLRLSVKWAIRQTKSCLGCHSLLIYLCLVSNMQRPSLPSP